MTGEEAEKNPAGLGREDPNGQKMDADDYHDHDNDDDQDNGDANDYDHDNDDDNDDEKNPGLITLCRNCKFEDTCELTNLERVNLLKGSEKIQKGANLKDNGVYHGNDIRCQYC